MVASVEVETVEKVEKPESVETCRSTLVLAGFDVSTPRVHTVAPESEASPAATPRKVNAGKLTAAWADRDGMSKTAAIDPPRMSL